MENLAKALNETLEPNLSLLGIIVLMNDGSIHKFSHNYDYMGVEEGNEIIASDEDAKKFLVGEVEGVYDNLGNRLYPPQNITPRDIHPSYGMKREHFKPA